MIEEKFPDITSPEIYDYCKTLTSDTCKDLQELEQRSMTTSDPKMISGSYLGQFLSIVTKIINPKTILEIGTYTGYGTLALSKGLQKGGIIHTIEKNPKMKGFADDIFIKEGISDNVVQHIGDAAHLISEIDATFDLVFMDAAKRQYIKYFDLVIDKMHSGGIILSDNVLWKGKVASANNDKLGEGLDAFNRYIYENVYVENIILPIDDGVHVIRKL